MKKIIVRLLIVALVAGAAWGGYALYKRMPKSQQTIATTKVRKGDVVVRSYTRGELRAVRSTTLVAPNLFGTVQVTRLAPLGAFAREKDLVIEFDDSELLSRIEEKQLELDQTDEQIKKAQAELNIRNNSDQVELLRARYGVRRAELEVKRNELLPVIDAKRNELTLEETRRRLKQLESDIKSRLESAKAEMAVLRARRERAVMELAREKQRLYQVKMLSPMSGLVSIRQNLGGGFRMAGSQVPDIREGDQVQPGTPVADVLDLSELEVSAKVGELDRANLREGQEVLIRLDAVPERTFEGRIKSLSATASANVFFGDPAKKFDVTFTINMKHLLSSLGAKPEQIARVLATAEQNRKKPIPANPMAADGPGVMMAGGPGGPAGGMLMAGAGGGTPGGPGEAGPGGREGRQGGGGRGGQQMSDEDRQKMRDALQKALGGKNMADLSQEERQAIFAKLRQQFPNMGGMGGGGGREGQGGASGAEAGPRMRVAGGERPDGPSAGGAPPMSPGGGTGTTFSQRDMDNAKLPPTPEEDSQLDVLLRPGLLADVEIIVEKIPDAVHVPAQAVFEREGKMIVWVRDGKAWQERQVKPLKRSESTMVIAEGLKPGEVIALSDPNARSDSKSKEKRSGAGSPMGAVPGGGRQGGQ